MRRTAPEDYALVIDGRRVPVRLRRNKRARRLILRTELDPDGGKPGVVVTLPKDVHEREALEWAGTQVTWISRSLGKLPERVPFLEGATIPLSGVDHVIRHRPDARRGVWTADGIIFVSGRSEHLARRVMDWLKKEACARITDKVHDKAGQLDVGFGRVAIRDPKSRWGSCASNGNLNFSWRLVMTPDFVFDYVVAHEVAHLLEHNHGAGFWSLVGQLTFEPERARAWLNSHGQGLHRYG